jgi:hypothetical protein
MIRAILDNKKTQTRRVIKEQPIGDATGRWIYCMSSTDELQRDKWQYEILDPSGHVYTERGTERRLANVKCPYGQPGDRLWVRETFQYSGGNNIEPSPGFVSYRADGEFTVQSKRWFPSIFMPRWASRITLEILSIGIERVQDISHADAVSEGLPCYHENYECALTSYRELWNALNAKRGFGWDVNPYVWVIGFKQVQA